MDKFGRNYILSVGTADEQTLTIKPPFTIEFDITRNTLTSANICQVRIFNLSQYNRNRLRWNSTNLGSDTLGAGAQFRPIVLKAGYGDDLAVIFTGNITQSWSVREGVNFITQIECFDGGFAYGNGETNRAFPAGTPIRDIIIALIESLPGVTFGVVGSFPGVITRGNSFSGNTVAVLQELTGGSFFIDNGIGNALASNEYIATPSQITVISPRSGLLGTPILEQSKVHFDMIFEPRLQVGHSIFLQSLTENSFNGKYTVVGVKHRGMISDAVCGTAVTTGEFFYQNPQVPVA